MLVRLNYKTNNFFQPKMFSSKTRLFTSSRTKTCDQQKHFSRQKINRVYTFPAKLENLVHPFNLHPKKLLHFSFKLSFTNFKKTALVRKISGSCFRPVSVQQLHSFIRSFVIDFCHIFSGQTFVLLYSITFLVELSLHL